MQAYQQEYLDNLARIAALAAGEKPDDLPFEAYAAQLRKNEARQEETVKRNMELLRGCLFPVLDDLFQCGEETVAELEAFSFRLYDGQKEADVGLFCQIRQALLTLARQKRDRNAVIRGLYWLGLGRNSQVSKLVGLELEDIEKYTVQMRLCFTEGAAYLKYYDEIDDTETRGYILRCRANIALGQFATPGEKVHLVKQTLQILQDKGYQEKEPNLPWDRFIYLTHQNMASSISYSREKVMTPQDMADIMESVYIVYQRRIQEAEASGKRPLARSVFNYYAIQYCCGIFDLNHLLRKMERLMDEADPADFSPEGMYCAVSLPAFYCQYLQQYPERVPERAGYLEGLYRRALDYVDAVPHARRDSNLFRFLRQLAYTFVETEHSVPYGAFLELLLIRFAPEVYTHARIVGEGAAALCGLIMEEEPDFFDDIGFIRAVGDRAEKRRAVQDFAMGCGVFHDVGKINVIELYSGSARQWLKGEYEMARLHTLGGEALLSQRASTRRYAAAALGHHSWYDGSKGYPEAYRRLECPERQMVDVISLVDWLDSVTRTGWIHTGVKMTFDEALEEAIALEGRRFSPLLTAWLRDGATARRLRVALEAGWRAACRGMYDDGGGKEISNISERWQDL